MLDKALIGPAVAILTTAIAVAACSSSSDSDDVAEGDTGGTTGIADGGGTDGGNGDDIQTVSTLDDVSGEITQFGFVTVTQSLVDGVNQSTVGAGFSSVVASVPASEVGGALSVLVETCSVDSLDIEVPVEDDQDDDFDLDFEFDFVNAGDNIVISSPGGTFATLQLVAGVNSSLYQLAEGTVLPSVVPSGLTVDIPGADFPAFSGAPIPDVMTLTGVDTGAPLTNAQTSFTWNPGSNPDAAIAISAIAFDAATLSGTSVNCITADDGAFNFPATVQAEIGSDVIFNNAVVSRIGVNFVTSGNSLLVLTHSSAAL